MTFKAPSNPLYDSKMAWKILKNLAGREHKSSFTFQYSKNPEDSEKPTHTCHKITFFLNHLFHFKEIFTAVATEMGVHVSAPQDIRSGSRSNAKKRWRFHTDLSNPFSKVIVLSS